MTHSAQTRFIVWAAAVTASVFCLPATSTCAEDITGFQSGGRHLATETLPSGPVTVGADTYEVDSDAMTVFASDADESVDLATWENGRSATSIALLHTFQPGRMIDDWRAATGLAFRKLHLPPDWPTVYVCEIEYADGETVEIPVRFGESIREWYRVHTVGPMLWARENWTKDIDKTSREKVAVYAMRVPNPRPNQKIVAIRAAPSGEALRDYGRALILSVSTDNTPLSGKRYFVARKPIGDDEQPGTYEKPFGTIRHALAVAEPGDSIYIRRAIYPQDEPLIKKFNGEEGKWLTLSAFPGESPTIDAFGIHHDHRVRPYSETGGREEIGRFQHDSGAIHIWGDPDCTRIQGLHIINSRRAAISVYGKPGEPGRPSWASFGDTQQIEIAFNTTFRSYSMGVISHMTDHIRVIGNRVIRPHALEMLYDVRTDVPFTGNETPQEAIDLSRNRHFEIAFNTVAGGSKEAIDCISVEDGEIHHNYVESSLNGIYIDAWTRPISRLNIHHNFIHNAYNGIPLATEGSNNLLDFQIHHNIITNTKGGSIAVTEATYKAKPAKVQGHRVHHNTIDRPGGHAIAIGWQVSGIGVAGFPDNENFRDVDILNNIVTNTQGRPMANRYRGKPVHDIVFSHNLIWPALEDTTPQWMRQESKSWRAEDFEKGRDTIVTDPMYVDPSRGDYRLRSGSPAIGAATDGSDLGALPHGAAWVPGMDFAGTITQYYHGPTRWQPVSIPAEKFTMHRNNLQRPSWFQRARYGPDFRQLPSGEQSIAGITWAIAEDEHSSTPSVMALAGHSSEAKAESITGIPVGRKAAKLAFLHNAHIPARRNMAENARIFHYRVHYADGSHVDIPIRRGIEVAHWNPWRPVHLKDARVAWYQRNRTRRNHDYIALYSYIWENPKPDVAIESIDIVRDAEKLEATPAVFAISTGTR